MPGGVLRVVSMRLLKVPEEVWCVVKSRSVCRLISVSYLDLTFEEESPSLLVWHVLRSEEMVRCFAGLGLATSISSICKGGANFLLGVASAKPLHKFTLKHLQNASDGALNHSRDTRHVFCDEERYVQCCTTKTQALERCKQADLITLS